jgi:nitroimidazol reductase NimA-like FMN-containing flavoprotein (pyridoxamine 5'-phosphate oxidase superfamily)
VTFNGAVRDPAFRDLLPGECRALLRSVNVGRVGVSVNALPAIFPIHYALLDDDVVFRIAPGGVLADVVPNSVVAFEADGILSDDARRWSVLVVGFAQLIANEESLEAARRLPLPVWDGHDSDRFTMIPSERVSGRIYPSPESPAPRTPA